MPGGNVDKQKRGNSLKNVLLYMMEFCKELGYIVEYKKDYKLGMPGYSDTKQFKAHYKLKFDDDSEWVVYTTTSLRDRIKEQYWDALNMKMLNDKITEAYLVYPDGLKEREKRSFVSKNNKIQNDVEYSTLEAILSQDSFFNRVEEHALREYTPSQQRDKKGNNFEKRIANILKNPCNLEKWKTQDDMLEGLHYSTFEEILAMFGVDRERVREIYSTSDKTEIGLLPSRGSAKTDVLTTITYIDDTIDFFTISCKRSSRNSVSVHQYSADQFAEVLDSTNEALRHALNEFQRVGNRRDMDDADAELLQQEIQPHILQLCEWAIGGVGGEGDPRTQWAKYLIIYDNNSETFTMHTTRDYCQRLAQDTSRAFGTPFSWTYQGERGSSIQLNCPLYL